MRIEVTVSSIEKDSKLVNDNYLVAVAQQNDNRLNLLLNKSSVDHMSCELS